MSVITLLTDFGVDDEYVGSMKGVILSIAPDVTLVDISHQIDPQDVVQAAYMLQSSYCYFPKNTVHLVVVDPGVGSGRSIIALRTKTHFFVAPDNGLLTFLFEKEDVTDVVRIENTAYFLQPVSTTFHGRDIFAPVGAHIAKGVSLRELGPSEDCRNLLRIPEQRPYVTAEGELVGKVIWIDRFGNLITNIDSNTLKNFQKSGLKESCAICVGNGMIQGLSETYGCVGPLLPLALISSRGYLEIALNRGDARHYFEADKGSVVKVVRLANHPDHSGEHL